MSSNIIIELSQTDATGSVNNNGEYTVNIGNTQDIVLNTGDSLVMNRAYLDTTASSSNKIQLSDPVTLTITYYHWVMDNNQTNKVHVLQTGPAATDDRTDILSGNCTLKCKQQTAGATTVNITGIKVKCTEIDPNGTGAEGGNCHFTINYVNQDGKADVYHGYLPGIGGAFSYSNYTYNLPHDIIADAGTPITATLQQPESLYDLQGTPQVLTTGAAQGSIFAEPIPYQTSVTVPAGKYEPAELASIISEEFQLSVPMSTTNITSLIPSNNILTAAQTTEDYVFNQAVTNLYGAVGPGGLNGWVRVKYAANDTTWVGSNSFALEWDSEFNKFKFSNIHMAFYSNSGNIVMSYQTTGTAYPVTPDADFINSAYSGLFISGLEPLDFWTTKLGFDPSIFTVNPNYWEFTDNAGARTVKLPNFSWNPGVNTTAQVPFLDTVIDKKNFSQVPAIAALGDIVSSNTSEIVATNQILENSVETPYYLIEINSQFKNTFVNSNNNYNNVMAMVGTYYSLGSFTSATSSDSLVYMNEGSPVTLNTFSVRILDSNKNLASPLLGPKNSIFLQILKAPTPHQDAMLSGINPADMKKLEDKK
jgi:hypothetical protein